MYGKITNDYLWKQGDVTESRRGTIFGDAQTAKGELIRWRSLDDDRIPYYGGIADDDALETIFEYCMHDAGATILQVWSPKGYEWKDALS